MAGTRSSTRNAGNSSSPAKGDDAVVGSKRKPEAGPSPKRSRKATKKQATLEESGITKEEDSEMKDASDLDGEKQDKVETAEDKTQVKSDDTDKNAEDNASNEEDQQNSATTPDTKSDGQAGDSAAKEDTSGDGPIEESSQREKQVPSNILEKGLVYFFTRNRVGIDDADSVGDLQRTFFVLRPLPTGAKLGDGAIPDLKNNRLFALPKKTFPKSHNDRFMAFVEKSNSSIQDLKDNFCMLSAEQTACENDTDFSQSRVVSTRPRPKAHVTSTPLLQSPKVYTQSRGPKIGQRTSSTPPQFHLNLEKFRKILVLRSKAVS
jgi:hypothetical protein